MVSSRVHSSDVYKLFLQAAMSRRVMSEVIAKTLWRKCYEAVERADPTKKLDFEDTNSEWDKFLDKIKRLLDPVDLELARFKDEDTGKVMYAVTNTKGDEVAQLASDYSPTEIAFFKAIIEQIMLAPKHAYCVSSTSALREVSHLKGTSMTKMQGEVIIASLVARGWLVKSKKGRLSLGSRTILELSNYLRNTYDDTDILECVACMELVTKGYMCPTANCNAPLHKHCYELLARSRRNLCPKCQQEWGEENTGLIPVGEAAVKDKDPRFERRRVRRVSGAGEEEEVEEESQMTQTQTQSQSQTQPSQSLNQSSRRTQTQTQARRGGKTRKASQAKVNGTGAGAANKKSKKRGATPEEEDQLDSMYDDDEEPDKDDDAIDIDNLAEIRERPSGGRIHRRR